MLALIVVAGCRDLVTPEVEGTPAAPRVDLLIFGLEGVLTGARVSLDNSAYTPGHSAIHWETISDRGVARFPAVPTAFDVRVEPDRGSPTPVWEALGLLTADSVVTVEFAGVTVEVVLDWALFGDQPLLRGMMRAEFSYWLPYPQAPQGGYGATHTIRTDGTGRIVGKLPAEQRYQLEVVGGELAFSLQYQLADSLEVASGAVLLIPDPERHALVQFVAGGQPLAPGTIRVGHFDKDYSWVPNALNYDLPRIAGAGPDSLYLLDVGVSQLELSWVDGPAFMPVTTFLPSWDQVPDQINLGDHELVMTGRDASGAQIPGALFVVRGVGVDQSITGGEFGQFRVFARTGTYLIEAHAIGYRQSTIVVDLAGDAEVDLELLAQ